MHSLVGLGDDGLKRQLTLEGMGSEVDVVARKRELRARVRAGRKSLAVDQRSAASAGFAAQLSALVCSRQVRSLSCFLPMPGEPDTREFLRWAEQHSLEVLFPSARADGLMDWIRPSGEGTIRGLFGTVEPLGECLHPLAVDQVDLMLVPAAAVDVRGFRLGWGRGYFDRMLCSMTCRPPVFAVIYDHELLESVPAEPHDIPVTGVITPTRELVF